MQVLTIAQKWRDEFRGHPLDFKVFCGVDEIPEAYYIRFHIWLPTLPNPPLWRYSVLLPKTPADQNTMIENLNSILENRLFDLIEKCAQDTPEHKVYNSYESLIGETTLK